MKMTFGMHKGEDIETIPMSYLWKAWEQGWLKGPLKEAVRQRIEPDRYDYVLADQRAPSVRELEARVKQFLAKHNAQDEPQSTISAVGDTKAGLHEEAP